MRPVPRWAAGGPAGDRVRRHGRPHQSQRTYLLPRVTTRRGRGRLSEGHHQRDRRGRRGKGDNGRTQVTMRPETGDTPGDNRSSHPVFAPSLRPAEVTRSREKGRGVTRCEASHGNHNPRVVGSSPTAATSFWNSPLRALGELRPGRKGSRGEAHPSPRSAPHPRDVRARRGHPPEGDAGAPCSA